MNKIKNRDLLSAEEETGFVETGFAKIDTEREARTGLPEIIYAPGKTKAQLVKLFRTFRDNNVKSIATRINREQATHVLQAFPDLSYFEKASILASPPSPKIKQNLPQTVAVVTAGTSDLPVAEEACITMEVLGVHIERFYDVGVAGLHRLIHVVPALREVDSIIVIAGMEGALPSVLGGLVKIPVIAVPTSVGYGSSFGGMSALLGMMNSCAPGVSVVNIDNGFGAAVCAYKWLLMINNFAEKQQPKVAG